LAGSLARRCSDGQSRHPALPGGSDVNLFRYRKSIVNLDAQVTHGAFDFRVAEQS